MSKNMFIELAELVGRGIDICFNNRLNNFLTLFLLKCSRTGESITLVTREDWKHSQELIRILEEAEQEVPNDLITMSERYAAWKLKHDAEVAACGGRRGRGGRGGGFGRRF